MELIAGDHRGITLAEIADGPDQLADAVVLLHGFADGGVGHVDAVFLAERLQDVVFALQGIEVQAVVVGLHGDLHELMEEPVLPLAERVEQLHVLHAAVHHGAAVGGDDAVQEIEPAFHRALQQGARVLAKEAGKVVGGDLHGTGARGAQPGGEGPRKIQQGLGGIVADAADADIALALRLLHQDVVGLLKQILKEDQVF